MSWRREIHSSKNSHSLRANTYPHSSTVCQPISPSQVGQIPTNCLPQSQRQHCARFVPGSFLYVTFFFNSHYCQESAMMTPRHSRSRPIAKNRLTRSCKPKNVNKVAWHRKREREKCGIWLGLCWARQTGPFCVNTPAVSRHPMSRGSLWCFSGVPKDFLQLCQNPFRHFIVNTLLLLLPHTQRRPSDDVKQPAVWPWWS